MNDSTQNARHWQLAQSFFIFVRFGFLKRTAHIAHVKHTENLVLVMTPSCFTRMWVSVEIATAFMNSVHVVTVSVSGCEPPDDAMIASIPKVLHDALQGDLASMGITEGGLSPGPLWPTMMLGAGEAAADTR